MWQNMVHILLPKAKRARKRPRGYLITTRTKDTAAACRISGSQTLEVVPVNNQNRASNRPSGPMAIFHHLLYHPGD